MFRLLYAIWPKSKDLYPTYRKATQLPRILWIHPVTTKLARLLSRESKVSMYDTEPNLGPLFRQWLEQQIFILFQEITRKIDFKKYYSNAPINHVISRTIQITDSRKSGTGMTHYSGGFRTSDPQCIYVCCVVSSWDFARFDSYPQEQFVQ